MAGDERITFLVVQEDPGDELLIRDELETNKVVNQVHILHDVPGTLAFLAGDPPFTGRQTPDIVLLDMRLPRYDGRFILKRLRTVPATADIPVILLVDSPAAEQILRCERLPVQGYAMKPVDFECLVGIVKNFPWLGLEVQRWSA